MANEPAIGTREGAVATATVEAPTAASAVTWEAPPSWLPRTFRALGYRNFRYLWLGQITNSLALWVDMVARPILILLATGSAAQVGLIVAARGVPMLFLQPLAGVAADRFDRRLLMLWSKGSTMVVNFVFAFLILSGQLELWHIYATALLKSVLQAFDTPARFALLPSLVPPQLLLNAIGLNSGSMQLVRTVSGGFAGFGIALFAILGERLGIEGRYFGIGATYLVASFVYMLAIFFTYMLNVPPSGRVERREETWFTSLITGFKFAARSQPILGVLILLAFQSSFGMPYLSVFVPLIAMQVMNFGFISFLGVLDPERQREIGLGLMMTVSGGGGLVGTLFIATYGERLKHKGRWVLGGLTGYGAAISLLGLSSLLPTVALAFGVVAFVGLGQAVVMSIKNAILIEQSPNELLGRVTSLQGLDRGFSTLGGLFSGLAAAALGAPVAMAIFGGLVIAGTMAVGSLLPGLRRVD